MNTKPQSLALSVVKVASALVALLLIAGCNQSKAPANNDIPVTTASSEAMDAFVKAQQYRDVGNTQLARNLYTKAIELDNSFVSAYVYRAGSSPTLAQLKEDIEIAEKYLEGKSEGEKLLVQLYKTFLNNDAELRIQLAKQLVSTYPKSGRAYTFLGNAYANINDQEQARQNFQKAVELSPDWAGGYFNLGSSYMNADPKDFNKAEANFLKCTQLEPDLTGSHIYLGDVYRAQNDLEKARSEYEKAISLNPEDGLTYIKRGHVYTFLGSYDEARNDYRKASELNPSDVLNPLVFEANTYIFAGDHKKAKAFLEEKANTIESSGVPAAQINAAKNALLTNYAFIAFHNQEVDEYERIIELLRPIKTVIGESTGTDELKLTQKASLLSLESTALAMRQDYAGAIAKAEEMKSVLEPIKNPNKLWGYYNVMSYISLKQAKYEEAIAHMEKSDPNAPYNRYLLGIACEKAGQTERAKTIFDALVIHNFNNVQFALIRKELQQKLVPA